MTEREKRANAEYLATICAELTALAERSGFETGAYLLQMAALEFANQRDATEQPSDTKTIC
jgi:hypothetical protein